MENKEDTADSPKTNFMWSAIVKRGSSSFILEEDCAYEET